MKPFVVRVVRSGELVGFVRIDPDTLGYTVSGPVPAAIASDIIVSYARDNIAGGRHDGYHWFEAEPEADRGRELVDDFVRRNGGKRVREVLAELYQLFVRIRTGL